MATIKMFVTNWCPYCKRALDQLHELQQEKPEYAKLTIEVVDEELEPELAGKYDYYYVPTFFLDSVKLHEGATTKDTVAGILDKAVK